MRDEIVITRSNLGQIASFVGVGALLIGVLGWLWIGWLSPYVQVALLIGSAGVAVWVALTPREFIDFVSGRRARQGTVAVFSVLLFLGIVGMFYIFVERAVITLDMTEAGNFTLNPETRRVLASLDRDVRITGFYSPRLVASRELDDQFFRQYEVESNGRITRHYIDPVRQPAIATAFRAQDGDVFISFVNPDGSVDMSSVSYVPMIDRQERDMTLAISRLLATGEFTIYFDLSLGELDPGDLSSRGISIFTQLLQANGFNTLPLDLGQLSATNGQVPLDASAVIIARPQTEITPEMVRVLGVIFMIGAVVLTGAHLGSGVLNATTLPFSAVLVIPAALGMWLGFKQQDRLDAERFRWWTLVVLMVIALNLVRRAVFG